MTRRALMRQAHWPSTPVIEDDEIVANLQPGGDEFADGGNDAARREVARGIVVLSHDQNPRMLTFRFSDQKMQQLEVAVIVREEHALFLDRSAQMNRIDGPDQTEFGGDANIVARLAQQRDQYRRDGVVVQVNLHGRDVRRIFEYSSGEMGFGFGLYL